MKLAEALILRSDLQKRVDQLRERLYRSAKVQENEQPPEDPQELLQELDHLCAQLESIIKKINKTNSSVSFSSDQTIADALAERDIIRMRRKVLADLIAHASVKQDRYSRSEVKFYPTVQIAELQREIDKLAKKYRELDTKIQELNWRTDLIE
jgi:uncharacterized coiled-coil DUF342 family protein